MDSAQTKLTNARMAVSLLGAAEEGTELSAATGPTGR